MRKLNMENVRMGIKDQTPAQRLERLKAQQIAVYVMIGGGFLGRFAAEQPADFYIDSRVGRLHYGQRVIYQAVEILKILAEECGFNGRSDMPKMMDLHCSGIW